MLQKRRMRFLLDFLPNYWAEFCDKKNAQKIAPLFDSNYYLSANPDVREAGQDARIHYIRYGWKEGRDPSPSFSTNDYLATHRELIETSQNPLLHFIEKGCVANPSGAATTSKEEIDTVSTEFDTKYYIRNYPEVRKSGRDPVRYFCDRGWRQGHNPNPGFSTSHYLVTNPDVKESGVNPYWHFLLTGRDEGRSPISSAGWQQAAIANLRKQGIAKQHLPAPDAPPQILDAQALSKRLAKALNCRRLIVSVGHDDYRSTSGGVQLCIGLEERIAHKEKEDYLNLHPWQPFLRLADEDSDPIVCAVLNGANLGCAHISQITAALSIANPTSSALVLHHLAGHSVEKLVELAKGLNLTECYLWLHDYFTICTSFTLQRNDVADCGAPDQNSNSCTLCLYGEERRSQLKRFQSMFDALEIHLISPSKIALEVWKKGANLAPSSERVVPHVALRRSRKINTCAHEFPERCRIAFVGHPSPHKGWPVFEELRRRLIDDDRYEFWHFSVSDCGEPGLRHVITHSQASNPARTIENLRDNQIDLVLHWANWKETFSFATFEAIAAGAFVITNSGSGNVAVAVRNRNAGCVLKTTEELFKMADDGELMVLANASREGRSSSEIVAARSKFTLEVLPEKNGSI